MAETYTLTIESDADHDAEEIEIPQAAVSALGDGESPTEMAGDLVMLGLAQQLHATVHHSESDTAAEVEEASDELEDAFEERFGMTFGEMTGHSH